MSWRPPSFSLTFARTTPRRRSPRPVISVERSPFHDTKQTDHASPPSPIAGTHSPSLRLSSSCRLDSSIVRGISDTNSPTTSCRPPSPIADTHSFNWPRDIETNRPTTSFVALQSPKCRHPHSRLSRDIDKTDRTSKKRKPLLDQI